MNKRKENCQFFHYIKTSEPQTCGHPPTHHCVRYLNFGGPLVRRKNYKKITKIVFRKRTTLTQNIHKSSLTKNNRWRVILGNLTLIHRAELQSVSFFQAIIIAIIIDYSYNYSQSPVIIATEVGVSARATRACQMLSKVLICVILIQMCLVRTWSCSVVTDVLRIHVQL